MSQTHPLKLWGRGSMWKNLKKLFGDSGHAGMVVLFMVVCVITPTIIIQGGFTIYAVWEIFLTVLLFLSLRITSEDK